MPRKLLALVTLATFAGLLSAPTSATYNANMIGVVADVLVYLDNDVILFRLSNQPTTHPTCNPAYFAIDGTSTESQRKSALARLLLAKATGESTQVGFDNAGNCSNTYIRVHRVG